MNDDVAKLKQATSEAAEGVHMNGVLVFVAYAEQVAVRLDWSVRKVVALWRNHEVEIGGCYRPAKYRRADPRAFNRDHRAACWTEAKFILNGG